MPIPYARILMLASLCPAPVLPAQVHFNAVRQETVQQRIDLYKGNDTQRERNLVQLFIEAGCAPANITEQSVPHRKQPNVLCVVPGATSETIVIGGHFDHVDAGDGIIDNWSGASLLPTLLQSLSSTAPHHTFIFAGFTGEEDGLLGSAFYVKQLSKDQITRIEGMINLDTLGLGPTEVWASQSDPHLVTTLTLVAKSMNLPLTGVDINAVGESDEESFIAQKVCTLTIHTLTPETLHVLHHPADNPTAFRFHDYYDTYRLLAAYINVLDTQLIADGHPCTAKPIEPSAFQRLRFRHYLVR